VTLPPGWRAVPDPEAEVRRLTGERAAPESDSIPRRDLDVLLAVAAAVLHADASATLDFQLPLPGDFTYRDVEEVVKRHGRRH